MGLVRLQTLTSSPLCKICAWWPANSHPHEHLCTWHSPVSSKNETQTQVACVLKHLQIQRLAFCLSLGWGKLCLVRAKVFQLHIQLFSKQIVSYGRDFFLYIAFLLSKIFFICLHRNSLQVCNYNQENFLLGKNFIPFQLLGKCTWFYDFSFLFIYWDTKVYFRLLILG